jgi:hypothetical protein
MTKKATVAKTVLSSKAKALLDAQVQFIVDQLTGKSLQSLVERELDALLAAAEKLTLNDAVTRTMIKDTALTYAADLELHGAIPELVGDVARALYAHKIQTKTSVKDLLSDERFEEVLEKILELKTARKQLVHAAVGNPLYADIAADLIYNGVKGYLNDNPLTKNIPGMSSMMKLGSSMMGGAKMEENVKGYIRSSLKPILKQSEHFLIETLDDDRLRDTSLMVWKHLKLHKLSEVRESIKSGDIEDFFVIGYEIWRELRKTAYYREMIGAGIDAFFDKYGDVSLAELLEEMGMTREILLAEAMRFAPHVLAVLKKKKLLEPAIRRNLESFYTSPAAKIILEG